MAEDLRIIVRLAAGRAAQPSAAIIDSRTLRSTAESVQIAFVDQSYTANKPAAATAEHGIALEVVKLPEAKRGFVLLPKRCVVERPFAWATRFRRLVKNYERCAQTLADFYLVAFECLVLENAAKLSTGS